LPSPLELLKHCITFSGDGDFWDVCAFFLLFCSAFRLATAEKLTTAFWKLHLLGVVQIELPLFVHIDILSAQRVYNQ